MAGEIEVNGQHVQLWDRNTIADGYKMAQNTIVPICSAITAGGAAVSAKIQEEIDRATNKENALSGEIHDETERATNKENELDEKIDGVAEDLSHEITERENEDRKLQDQIDTINAGTDVINVYGTYDNFTETSGDLFSTSAITDQDVVKVLNDPNQYPDAGLTAGSHQTYFRWNVTATVPHKPLDPTDGEWLFIGYTDPYYNTAEIDEKFEDISATVLNNYLSANGVAVQSGHNIVITKPDGDNTPHIKIETSSHVTFDGISSTNLSATNASGENLKYDYVTAVNLSSTNISANSLSATTLSAATAYGESAKYTNVSSTNLTALTASGNLAQYITLSGQTIKGATSSIIIDNLINSAVNGGAMTGLKNASAIVLNFDPDKKIEFDSSASEVNLYVSGGASEWLGLEIDSTNHAITVTGNLSPILSQYLPKAWSSYNDSLFSGTSRSAQSAGSATFAYSASLANSSTLADSARIANSAKLAYSATLADSARIANSAALANSASLANSSTYTYSATTANKASTAGYADTANSSYSSQSSQYAVNAGSAKTAYSSHSATSADNAAKLAGVDADKYMVSTNLYSNTSGVITAYGTSAIGCVGDYLEKSAVNAGVGYAYSVGDSAFAQGSTITAKSASLAQGINNNAYNKSFAQGVNNTARNASVAQGYSNTATNTAQAFGQGLQISEGMAIGKYNYSTDVAFVIGNGTADDNRKDLLAVTRDGDLQIISASGSVFEETHISPSGVTYRSHGAGQPGITEESATWHQILSTSGVPRAYASDFGQVLAVNSAANSMDWSDRYKLKKGPGAYDDCFETSQQIKRTDSNYTYIYIENAERRLCFGVSTNGNVRLGEETGKTRSPSTTKSIIYSLGSADNTTYHFNGSALGATNSDFAKTANSAYSAYYAQSAISSYYSEEAEDSVRLGNRPDYDYALTGGTYTASNQLRVNSAVNAGNSTKWKGYELLLGTLPTQGQNQIAFI